MGIYIEMILSSHVINNIDLELNNSEESIPRIEFRGIIIFTPGTKYY